MTFTCIKVKDLVTFLESETFKQMPVLPISKRRGQAHAVNPRAQAEDVALLLTYLEDRMVGYLGFLPDDIHQGKTRVHVAWMSCIWVDPNTRGKGIAKAMLRKGFEVWEDRLLATEFTAPAKRLYDKMELFDDLLIHPGMRCYLRFNLAKLLPASRPKLKSIQGLLRIGDFLLNGLNTIRLGRYAKELDDAFQVKISATLDAEANAFIEHKNDAEFFKRDQATLQWALAYPWLGDQAQDQSDAARYDFSVYSTHFKFSILKIKKQGTLQALLILAERADALKVPYCWLETGMEALTIKAIWQYMLRHKLSILTFYQRQLIPFLKTTKTPFYLQRPFSRHYLISKKMSKDFIPKDIHIQDGDGDCAFT